MSTPPSNGETSSCSSSEAESPACATSSSKVDLEKDGFIRSDTSSGARTDSEISARRRHWGTMASFQRAHHLFQHHKVVMTSSKSTEKTKCLKTRRRILIRGKVIETWKLKATRFLLHRSLAGTRCAMSIRQDFRSWSRLHSFSELSFWLFWLTENDA